jgi:peptidoglycan LD-endopeptidase CwlK
MNRFGKTSRARLATCHKDLQLVLNTAIKYSPVDFGIAEGHRPVEKQLEYFNAGKSKIDGVTKKGKHNYIPSMAVDIYAFVNGKAEWNNETLSYMAGLIQGIAKMLFSEGKISHSIRWGGNWDRDGEILFDQKFDDLPHLELI